MPLIEAIATAVAQKVLDTAASQATGLAVDRSSRKADTEEFARVLQIAYRSFETNYPQWASSLVDASFLEVEAAPRLAKLFVRGGVVTPAELAEAWADSIAMRRGPTRRARVRELETPMAYFLAELDDGIAASAHFRPLVDAQALQSMSRGIEQLVSAVGASRATPGTLTDYLRWLTERYHLVDPRGIHQTERQVQVPLDRVYVALSAVDEKTFFESLVESEERAPRHDDNDVIALGEILGNPRVVLLGDPGSGKTTILRYLALRSAQAMSAGHPEIGDGLGEARLPILIRVADYAESGLGKSLSSYLLDWHELADAPTGGLGDLFATSLERGESLVLLDGLDEIVEADARHRIVARIDDLVQRHSAAGNRFVITSRVAGYREMPLAGNFRTFRIQPMSDQDIDQFLQRWCRAVESASGEASFEEVERRAKTEIVGIRGAIDGSEGVRRLATNPLLLTILALIHRAGAALPQRRIELYDLAVGTLARTWRQAQGVPEAALVSETLLTRVLSTVAYWLHVERPSGVAPIQALRPVVQQRWAEVEGFDWNPDDPPRAVVDQVEEFLTAVRVQTGLLTERAPTRYGFMHLTFEEYYVARHLVTRHTTRVSAIRRHLHDPRWEEPILLALGYVGLASYEDAAALVDAAVLATGEEADAAAEPSRDEEVLGRDFLFAIRCLADRIPIEHATRGRLLRQMVAEIVHGQGRGQTLRYVHSLTSLVEGLEPRDRRTLVALVVDAMKSDGAVIEARVAELLRATGEDLADAVVPVVDDWARRGFDLNQGFLWQLIDAGAPRAIELFTDLVEDETADRWDRVLALAQLVNRAPAASDAGERALVDLVIKHISRAPVETLAYMAPAAGYRHVALLPAVLEHVSVEAFYADPSLGDDDVTDWPEVRAEAIYAVAQIVQQARAAGIEGTDAIVNQRADSGDPLWSLVDAVAAGGDVPPLQTAERFVAALRSGQDDLVMDALDEVRAWLEDVRAEPEVIDKLQQAARPLLDREAAAIRLGALDVLLWGPVDPVDLGRAMARGLSELEAEQFAELDAADENAFIDALRTLIGDGEPAPLAIFRALGRRCLDSPEARTAVKGQLAYETRRDEAFQYLVTAPELEMQAALCNAAEDLAPSAIDVALLVAYERGVLKSAGAVVLRLAARHETCVSVLSAAFITGDAPSDEVLEEGLMATDEGLFRLSCDVASRTSYSPSGSAIDSLLLRLSGSYADGGARTPAATAAAREFLIALGRRRGGISGSIYASVLSHFLASESDASRYSDGPRSRCYSALLGIAAPQAITEVEGLRQRQH